MHLRVRRWFGRLFCTREGVTKAKHGQEMGCSIFYYHGPLDFILQNTKHEWLLVLSLRKDNMHFEC